MIARFLAWVRRRRSGGYWQYVRDETIQERAAKLRPGFIRAGAMFMVRPVYRWVPERRA